MELLLASILFLIGLGLIGGSIARGLRRANKDITIMAYMRTRSKLEQAKKEGTIDIGAYEYETVSLTPFGGNILYVKSSEAVSDKENNGETWERATSNIHQAIQVLAQSQ